MKRLVLPILVAALLYGKANADLYAVPQIDVNANLTLDGISTEGEAPQTAYFIATQTNDDRLPGGTLFYRVHCDTIDADPVESADTNSAVTYIANTCPNFYDKPGTYHPFVEVVVRYTDREVVSSTVRLPEITIEPPSGAVAVVDLSCTSGLEPHDPTCIATAVGPTAGAVEWKISFNGDDGAYEVTSADVDRSLSSAEGAAQSAAGVSDESRTVCATAKIGATTSPKVCTSYSVTAQRISSPALVCAPSSGTAPLNGVTCAASWQTNGGAVDLIFKADAGAGCPAFPGDDADCFQVNAFAGMAYDLLADGGVDFDYSGVGDKVPSVTITDDDAAAPGAAAVSAVHVTAGGADPVFGIAFTPDDPSCQLSGGSCCIELAPSCSGDAEGEITEGALTSTGGTCTVGDVADDGPGLCSNGTDGGVLSRCCWTTAGSKTVADSGFTREGEADTDTSTSAVTVDAAPAVADLSASCTGLSFLGNKGVGEAAPPCQTCSVRNIGTGTLATTNTLTMQGTAWGATRTPATNSTTTEIDSVSVCAPDPDTLNAGTNLATLLIANDADAGDNLSASVRYDVVTPQQGDPTWFIGRDGSGRPLIASGNELGTLTEHRVDKRATPNMTNLLGAGQKQYDENFINSYSENGLVYYSTFDRKNGQPSSVDCVPLTECGTLPDGSGAGKSDPDAVHFWSPIRYQSLLVVGNWFKNSIFRNTTCTSSSTCPHADLVQFYMANDCPGAYTAFINNRFGSDPTKGSELGQGGSDSGQQFHGTSWGEVLPTCDVKAFLLQGNIAVQDPGPGCTARGVGTYTGTRACGKYHFQVPVIASAGKSWSVWCIENQGITLKGGATGTPIVAATRIVKVGECSTSSIIGSPTIVTYSSVEAAIAGETAAGKPIPAGIGISCKGRATPPAGCLNTVGDPD